MTERGYKTSSRHVKEIIKKEGLSAFVVERCVTAPIRTPFPLDVASFETFFLENNDCAGSDEWFNKHNNQGANFASDSYKEKVQDTMLLLYGVTNAMHIPEVKQKVAEAMKGNQYGAKPRSAETKARMSAAQKGRVKSPQHCAALSAAKIGIRPDEATRKKMSESRRGKHRPQSWHDKMAEYRKSVAHILYTCPHCGKSIRSKASFHRWHGNNCKQRVPMEEPLKEPQ